MADGPIIQRSYIRALKSGSSLIKTLNLVKIFRNTNNYTPVVLMGYYNLIYQMGEDSFLKNCKTSGVDGLIVVDLPFPENKKFSWEDLKKIKQKIQDLNIRI